MARILRGEIRWADLNPVRGRDQAGLRPVLILSHDVFNDRSGTVIAVALTSREPRAGFPLTLESGARGLPKRSWIKISQIRTLAVERIGRRIARSTPEEVSTVLEGLGEIIGDAWSLPFLSVQYRVELREGPSLRRLRHLAGARHSMESLRRWTAQSRR